MHGRGEGYADEGPIIIVLLSIHLLTIVFSQVSLSQTLIHLQQYGSFCAPLRTDQTNHEPLLNTETKHSLNESTNDLQVHESDDTVLEEICAHLVEVLALVLVRFLKGDKLGFLGFPRRSVIYECLGQDATLAACLDHIIELRLVDDRVVYLVAITILDADPTGARNHCTRHTLRLVFFNSSETFCA